MASATYPAPSPTNLPEVTLLTRRDCHLCEDARAVVATVTGDLGLPWQEVSIDSDPVLRDRYAEEIPVVLVDGRQRDFWQIDPVRLAKVLRHALDHRPGA